MKRLSAAACAILLGFTLSCAAQHAPPELVPISLAIESAQRTIYLIENRAVYPRKQEEYAQAKAELVALLQDRTEPIERPVLSAAITKVLKTLDADGHSFVNSPVGYANRQRVAAPMAEPAPALRLIKTAKGTALHWTPPQIVSSSREAMDAYLKRFSAEAGRSDLIGHACALVLDLSQQKGGNAWPAFTAMKPLLGTANRARMVDRNGNRESFVSMARLNSFDTVYTSDHPNPLTRFAEVPFAVIVGAQTASAGEMLLVALMGEGERVQTFGHTSAGMSTANMTYPMPDGSALILTEHRYAVGDQPVIRGGIPVAHPAAPDESADATVLRAAEWATSQSPLCAAPPKA